MGDFGYSDPKSISDIFKYTSGSVLFVDSDGIIAQDNAGLSFDPVTDALTVGGNLEFKSGTAFKGIFDHANGANRTYTLPDITGTLVIGGGGQGLIVNSDINAAAGIVYSKLALTNSIVDGDIVSITTRSKLPSAIAYEDEANTFSQIQTFNANISVGSNRINFTAGYLLASGVTMTWKRTSDDAWLNLNADAAFVRIIRPRDGSVDSLIIADTTGAVNANSRTWSNFVAASPTFSGTMAAAAATFSGTIAVNSAYIGSDLGSPQVGIRKDGVNGIAVILVLDNQDTGATTGGRITFGTKTSDGSLNRSIGDISLQSTTKSTTQVRGGTFRVRLADAANGTLAEKFTVEADGDILAYADILLDSAAARDIKMGSNDILTFNTDNSMNFNSRLVSNLTLGSSMNANNQTITSVSDIQGTTSGGLNITGPRTVGTDAIVFWSDNGAAANVARAIMNRGAVQGSSGIKVFETLYFGANATGFAYAAQAAITADGVGGNLILNAPTAKNITARVNGAVVLTIAGALITAAQPVTLSSGGAFSGTITGTPTFSGAVVFSGGPSFTTADVTITDVDIVLGTATGTMIGTAANQKIGLWGAVPVVQQAHIADPAGGAFIDAEARTAINGILAQLATVGIQAPA